MDKYNFEDYLHPLNRYSIEENHWFESIVSWQHPIEGCYGNDTIHIEKREEMQMSHDCLSHRTSVAIAALSQILRYMLSRDI